MHEVAEWREGELPDVTPPCRVVPSRKEEEEEDEEDDDDEEEEDEEEEEDDDEEEEGEGTWTGTRGLEPKRARCLKR